MKRTVLSILFISILPAFCYGSTGPGLRLGEADPEGVLWRGYSLELQEEWVIKKNGMHSLDLPPLPGARDGKSGSLDEIRGGLPCAGRPVPRDMVSMMSFVWAQMFGGVDIVAEVRDFARQIRNKGRLTGVHRGNGQDSRNRWSFVVACRIDALTEVAASFNNRGKLFGEGDLSLEINALDPLSEEVGLKIAYSGGDLGIRADRLTLTDTAQARLVVKF